MYRNLKPLDLSKIRTYPYPENKYFKVEHQKLQILLHHTVSGPNIEGDVKTWINGKHNVGTCIIVARDGTPWQLFSSRYWAYHLGSGDHNQDRRSIGIELDNWGGLKPGSGSLKMYPPQNKYLRYCWRNPIKTNKRKFYAYYGNAVDVPMEYYPDGYRGYNYYEKYTEAQIRTVGELSLLWKDRYDIPLDYNEDMWDISSAAKAGKPGIWSHTSFRSDKSDVHPQPELIEMLKTVQNL